MKNLLLSLKILVALLAIMIGIYLIVKARIKVNLNNKLEMVYAEWDSLSYLQNLNKEYLCKLIRSDQELEKTNDSIAYLFEKCQSITTDSNCNDTVIATQYKINESFLALKRLLNDSSYAKSPFSDSLLNLVEISALNLNTRVKEYNTVVKEFNLFYSTFPVFLIAKSHGFKRQPYFELYYGKSNKDPIAKKNEIPEWQRKIEEEYGFTE